MQTGRGYKRSRPLQVELLALAAEREPMRTHLWLPWEQESKITTMDADGHVHWKSWLACSMWLVNACMHQKGVEPQSSARLWDPRALPIGHVLSQDCWWHKSVVLEVWLQVCDVRGVQTACVLMFYHVALESTAYHCCFIIAACREGVCVFQIITSWKYLI